MPIDYNNIIKRIRSGEIEEKEAEICSASMHIVFLRDLLTLDDFEPLSSMASEGSIFRARLAINLLNRSLWQDKNKPSHKVIDFLSDVWAKAVDYRPKHTAMMVLLEDEKTANANRAVYYDDLKNNFDEFLIIMRGYCQGGASGVLGFCEDRLNDRAYPPYKKWTYLCGVVASDEKGGARKLLSRYSSGKDFDAFVAKEMLDKL